MFAGGFCLINSNSLRGPCLRPASWLLTLCVQKDSFLYRKLLLCIHANHSALILPQSRQVAGIPSSFGQVAKEGFGMSSCLTMGTPITHPHILYLTTRSIAPSIPRCRFRDWAGAPQVPSVIFMSSPWLLLPYETSLPCSPLPLSLNS